MWRSQRARESIITYRYELAPDTAWYLSMRLHLLWCDASFPNDICYAISVRFIFRHWHPPATVFTCTLVVEKTLFSDRAGALNSGPSTYWASTLPPSYNPRFLGEVWMFSTGDWISHCPVHCPGKTENWNYFCCLPQGQSQDCSLQAVGPLWWMKEFLTKETEYRRHLTSNTSCQPTCIDISSTIHKSHN